MAFEEIDEPTRDYITPKAKKITAAELHDMQIREEAIKEFVKMLKEEYKPVYDSDTDLCQKVFNRWDKIAEQTLEKWKPE